MKINQIYAMYFSPTGGTKKVVSALAKEVGRRWNKEVTDLDYTPLNNRKQRYVFEDGDLVFMGMPVYAGRIPNKILPDLERDLKGSGATLAVSVSVYGNRSGEQAVRESVFLLENQGFLPMAAVAAVSRHTFSQTLAAGRPDETDMEELKKFGREIAQKIERTSDYLPLKINRTDSIGAYYTPLQEDGTPAKFLKAKPLVDAGRCNGCGKCANVCPMGSISNEDLTQTPGICIKCQACIRECPEEARYFADPQFLSHVRMLEHTYEARNKNEIII